MSGALTILRFQIGIDDVIEGLPIRFNIPNFPKDSNVVSTALYPLYRL